MDEATLQRIKGALSNAKRVVFLGGAGVSTASGIPDFRSTNGLYSRKREDGRSYEDLLSIDYFEEDPKGFYDFYWSTMVVPSAKPNPAHLALTEYQKRHHLAILTQNIDGLHQMAGSSNVYEFHGSTYRYACRKCGKKFTLDELDRHGVPICPSCGGIIKPEVVLYGEALPSDALYGGIEEVRGADVMIVAGTSLRVYPFASVPNYFRGRLSVLINAEPTPSDAMFDIVLHEDLVAAITEILHE